MGIIIALVGLLLLIASVVLFGGVWGEEFSPDTFRRRTFAFFEIPVVRLQVSPVKRVELVDDVQTHLTSAGLIPKNAKPQWEVVKRNRRISGASPPAPAGILLDYFDMTDGEGATLWLQWSKDHPKLAALLWPEVLAAAAQRLYWFMPELFALARDAKDESVFRRDLNRLAAEKYFQAGEIQRQLGRSQQAERLYQEALRREPQMTEAQKALAALPKTAPASSAQ
jgi:hypothetical protein